MTKVQPKVSETLVHSRLLARSSLVVKRTSLYRLASKNIGKGPCFKRPAVNNSPMLAEGRRFDAGEVLLSKRDAA